VTEQLARRGVVCAAFDRERTLPGCVQQLTVLERHGGQVLDVGLEPQQARDGHDDPVELTRRDLGQSRAQVAAQRLDEHVTTVMLHLGSTGRRRRPEGDRPCAWQVDQSPALPGDERITGVGPGRHRPDHETVGRLVATCESRACRLAGLALPDFQSACDQIAEDVYDVLGVKNAVAALSSYGSGGKAPVEEQLARWREKLS
jgi:hypothetical protein